MNKFVEIQSLELQFWSRWTMQARRVVWKALKWLKIFTLSLQDSSRRKFWPTQWKSRGMRPKRCTKTRSKICTKKECSQWTRKPNDHPKIECWVINLSKLIKSQIKHVWFPLTNESPNSFFHARSVIQGVENFSFKGHSILHGEVLAFLYHFFGSKKGSWRFLSNFGCNFQYFCMKLVSFEDLAYNS